VINVESVMAKKTDYTRHQNRKIPCDKKNKLVYKYDEMIKKMETLEKTNNSLLKRLVKLENKDKNNIKKIKNNTKNINNSTTNNDNRTTNNINNSTTNNIIVIPKLAFGKEDLSFLTDEMGNEILKKGFNSILEYVKLVHFLKDHPENHNVFLSNINDKKHVSVHDGEKWILERQDKILPELKDKGIDYIQKKYDELDKNDPKNKNIITKIKRFIDCYNDDRVEELDEDLLLLLYNNRNTIKK